MKILFVSRLCVLIIIMATLAGACTAPATPAPTATPEPTPTIEPTDTPLPPQPTLTPTKTPVPKPSIKQLRFATSKDMSGAQSDTVVYDLSIPAVYAAVDYADVPKRSQLSWTLTRDGTRVFGDTTTIEEPTGTLTHVMIDNPRRVLPGDYKLTVKLSTLTLTNHFTISLDKLAPGATILTETFDDNLRSWDEYLETGISADVTDGQLRLSAKEANASAYTLLPVEFGDFDLTIAVRQEEGPRDGFISVLFRQSDAGGYSFDIFPAGYFDVGVAASRKFSPLIDMQYTNSIKRNMINYLRVVARGDKFTFYINDTLVGTATDAQYARGEIGFAAGNFKQSGMIATFDNLVLTMPKDEIVIAPTKPAVPAATAAPKPTTGSTGSVTGLKDAIIKARLGAEDIGGAMDRLYGGSGAEACSPLLRDYAAFASAPTYDVSGQPGNVQQAYGLYRQAVELLTNKIRPIANVCNGGGGGIGKLDFDLARGAINDGASLLTQAQNALQ